MLPVSFAMDSPDLVHSRCAVKYVLSELVNTVDNAPPTYPSQFLPASPVAMRLESLEFCSPGSKFPKTLQLANLDLYQNLSLLTGLPLGVN